MMLSFSLLLNLTFAVLGFDADCLEPVEMSLSTSRNRLLKSLSLICGGNSIGPVRGECSVDNRCRALLKTSYGDCGVEED